ncbi:hypothetical protein VTP01DRAFT_6604 [Rhizomucor pusillus]|uniref:uncharacterized protein n=1 Tax=Rhizomucor pusillus TaxID=4840 RepID=UPI003743D0C7
MGRRPNTERNTVLQNDHWDGEDTMEKEIRFFTDFAFIHRYCKNKTDNLYVGTAKIKRIIYTYVKETKHDEKKKRKKKKRKKA